MASVTEGMRRARVCEVRWRSRGQHPPPTRTLADRWWRDGVVYQVYPRSFADSNGDGVGDLPGLIDHLDHLAGGPDSLGVDAIWLSPIYPSPMLDGGYDVMDYTAVDPVFGTLADFDRLVEECHRRGIRVILDLVMNHTSDLHPWFVQSRESRTGPFADFYLWRDPSGWDDDGRPEPPNNWLSWFGGSAWAWEPRREQFYLHTFLPEQPDVNWRCAGASRRRCGRWSGAGSTAASMGSGSTSSMRSSRRPRCRRTRRSRRAVRSPGTARSTATTRTSPSCTNSWPSSGGIVDARPGTATVGELFTNGIEAAVSYWAPRHLVFDWVLLETEWIGGVLPRGDRRPGGRLGRSLADDRAVQPRSLAARLAVPGHDRSSAIGRRPMPWRRPPRRSSSRCEGRRSCTTGRRSAPWTSWSPAIDAQDRAAARMPDWWNRDGCRAPMAWSGDADGGLHERRAVVAHPAGRGDRATSSASGRRTSSVLAHYRRLLALRRGSAALRTGDLALVDVGDPDVLAYLRRAGDDVALVVVRFGLQGGEIELPSPPGPWRVVLSSHDQATPDGRVAPRRCGPLEAIVLASPTPAYASHG